MTEPTLPDLDYLVATQDDHPPDVTIECPCGCGGRLAPKMEQINGEYVSGLVRLQ